MTGPVFAAGDKLLATGGFKRGKSNGLAHIATRSPAALVFDPTGEFDQAPFVAVTIDQAPAAVLKHPYVAVQAAAARDSELDDDFDAWCELALRLVRWVVVVDEISLVVRGSGQGAMPNAFSRLWRFAHKQDTGIAIATHRLKEIPGLLRMVNHQVFYQDDAPLNLSAAEELVGPAVAEIPRLKPWHYLYKGPGIGPVVCEPTPLVLDSVAH